MFLPCQNLDNFLLLLSHIYHNCFVVLGLFFMCVFFVCCWGFFGGLAPNKSASRTTVYANRKVVLNNTTEIKNYFLPCSLKIIM